MIGVVETKTGFTPMVFCDHCGGVVTGKNGVVAYLLDSKTGGTKIECLHRRICLDQLEHSAGQRWLGWIELDRFLSFLIENSGIKIGSLQEAEHRLFKVGL